MIYREKINVTPIIRICIALITALMPFYSRICYSKQNASILQFKYAITNQTYISFVEILHYSPKLFPYGEKITHEFQKQMEVTN